APATNPPVTTDVIDAAPTTDAPLATDAAPSTDAGTSLDDVVPTAGNGGGTAPETGASPEQGGDYSAVEPIVQAFVDERGLNGAGLVVVERDAGVVYEHHWGEFTPDRISLVASSSKMITAGVLLRLSDDGLLDMDAPVADAVEWGGGNPDITPAQLVSNSSGLVGLLPNPGYAPYVCQYVASGTLQDCAAQIFTSPDDDGDIVAPDTEFRYGGAQWQVAGAVAEAVSGRSWAELIDEIYVQPCGLDALGYNNHFTQIGSGGFAYPTEFAGDPETLMATDNPNMEGGAFVTTGDYAKLLLMHLRGGTCGDERVLSQGALDTLHADRTGTVYGSDTGYGMGWWVDRATGRISDAGAYGSVPWLDLEDGYGAFLVVEADAVTGGELAAQLYDIVESAATA
ncbi:MAG: serine hydrolase domain-containing protein, partial [Ilumatobacter sp.]